MKKYFNRFGSSQKGFTLIELLITLVLFSMLSLVVTNILFISLRASSKATHVASVRQAGTAVVSQFSNDIRTASTFVGVSASIDPNNQAAYTRDCTGIPPVGGYRYLKVVPVYDTTKITYFQCDNTDLRSSTVATNALPDLNSDASSLFDVKVVKVVSCSMACTQQPGHAPVVGLSFQLDTATSGLVPTLPEKSAPLSFQTSEVVRNY